MDLKNLNYLKDVLSLSIINILYIIIIIKKKLQLRLKIKTL